MSKPGTIETPCGWLIEALLSHSVAASDIEAFVGAKIQVDALQTFALPSESYRRLFEWGTDATGDPDLGLHIAADCDGSEFGILSYIVENSRDLGACLENLSRYNKIFSRDSNISLVKTPEEAVLEVEPIHIGDSQVRQDTIFTVATIVFGIRRLVDPAWSPLRCGLTVDPPANPDEMIRVFDCGVQFLQATNTVVMDRRDLDLPLPGADTSLLAIVMEKADQILEAQGEPQELVHQLRLLIASNLVDTTFGMRQAAEALNMSVRTLRRELASRATSFRKLRDSVVHEAARSALVNTGIPITQIAHRMGYSETSAFSRAFKRIEGVSPISYRAGERWRPSKIRNQRAASG